MISSTLEAAIRFWNQTRLKRRLVGLVALALALPAQADFVTIQIESTDNADFGAGTIATMVSEIHTAPDGLATFQIAIDVAPPSGRSIQSGITGSAGTATSASWGIGPEDSLFKGSDNDASAEISNPRVINFNANGGQIGLSYFADLSFTAITIANGQSTGKDAIRVTVNGGPAQSLGALGNNPGTIDLPTLAKEGVAVKSFRIGTDSLASDNKWSVNHIEVMVDYGGRADWLRGSWGINWKPSERDNGLVESLVIDDFLEQISGLKTIDYIQTHLNESHISSPVHWGTHDILESLWQGDTDANGNPINLVVPRASIGFDPFREMLLAVKAAGMKNQVYVNSSNMLEREPGEPTPSDIPNITARWKEWCDTHPAAQAFIASQPYHRMAGFPEREYMFCYAEFVLKEYAIRYGDLIDGWLFDSGRWMWQHNGDSALSGELEDQRIYQAFAEACHAGNPNAAISFNNSPGESDGINNPFTPATLYDDYMFGHPFQGGKSIGERESGRYDRNYSIIQWIVARGGNAHIDDGPWTWDDRVVAHFDPPMSTSAWNSGGVPALTNDEFILWNREALLAGGAMSWGAPLRSREGTAADDVLIQDWGMNQLTLMDQTMSAVQFPDVPNWARAETPLPDGFIGLAYKHSLISGEDFWDPQGGPVSGPYIVSADNYPTWLEIEESGPGSGTWILSGFPDETSAADYTFTLRVSHATGHADRQVHLRVNANENQFIAEAPGYPVWAEKPLFIPDAEANTPYTHTLIEGRDFRDDEEEDLSLQITAGISWLTLTKTTAGHWQLSGTPGVQNKGLNTLIFSLSDGTHTTENAIRFNVNAPILVAEVLATADTHYGTGNVATLLSDTYTAYDGLATFQIAFDIVPTAGTSIRSGDGGGNTNDQSWGIASPGETTNAPLIFNGDSGGPGDAVESIGNLRVVNFNNGGGALSEHNIENLSFKSITIADAQSGAKDAVYVTVGSVTTDLNNLGSPIYPIELEALPGVTAPVDVFSIGTSTSSTFNKWSVNSVEVYYSVEKTIDYTTWALNNGLTGNNAHPDADTSDFDGYSNLAEFAFGLNPNLIDTKSPVTLEMVAIDGVEYLQLIYKRRSNYNDLGLSYLFYEVPDLVPASAFLTSPDQVLIDPPLGDFESVKNRFIIGGTSLYIQMHVE